MSRIASLRALERAVLACFKTPFDQEGREPNPIFKAYLQEVMPLLDREIVRAFAKQLNWAREYYHDDSAAMGATLAWIYDAIREEGETP